MKRFTCILCLLLGTIAVAAQQSWMGLGFHPADNAAYNDAFDRLDDSDYLDAARRFRSLRRHVDSMRIETNEAALDYAKLLKNEGNCWYMVGNKPVLREVTMLYQAALRRYAHLLTEQQRQAVELDGLKLEGSWHYEVGDDSIGSYQKAEVCYRKCLDFYRLHNTLSTARTDTAVLHQELAQLYYKQQRYEQALSELEPVVGQYYNEWYNDQYGDDEYAERCYYDALSQQALCLARVGRYAEAVRKIDEAVAAFQRRGGAAYAECLRKKAKILLLQHGGQDAALALPFYKSYFSLRRQQALQTFAGMSASEREQFWMRVRPFMADCYQVGRADAAFLYDVTLFSKGLLLQFNRDAYAARTLSVTWQQLQQRLPQGSCAVEFVQYEQGGRQQMGALVLGKKGRPSLVSMPSPDSIYNHLVLYRTVRQRLLSVNGNDKNVLYQDSAGLFRMIWNADLLRAIGPARTVYFAPDGYLHQLAVEYMLPQEASGLTLRRLSSTRLLMERPDSPLPGDSALVVGGVSYEAPLPATSVDNDAAAFHYVRSTQSRFNHIAGSRPEVDSIMNYRCQPADTLLVAGGATETAFRQLCGRYPVVHVSTHGLFGAATVSQGTDLKPCLTDAALSESMLAMAGVQWALYDAAFNPEQRQDGVLSARELSTLRMQGVRLLVLACCQTGLGYVTSDGVYGIQRGFKNAGVGAMIMSLWNVDDTATNLFMTTLHRELQRGVPLTAAFTAARAALASPPVPAGGGALEFNAGTLSQQLAADADGLDYNLPYYRDAFILIDALE